MSWKSTALVASTGIRVRVLLRMREWWKEEHDDGKGSDARMPELVDD